MPVKNIDLNNINWSLVDDKDVRELYDALQGEVCYNRRETCKAENTCSCPPCHRCGHQKCVCQIINQPFHTDCGRQLACWCEGVEELNVDVVGLGSYDVGGSVTSRGTEQSGSGTTEGPLKLGIFKYTPKAVDTTENIFLRPQGGSEWETVGKHGKVLNKGSTLPPPIPIKRTRDDIDGRGASNIVNQVRRTREVQLTERGERVTLKDAQGNVQGSYLKDEVFEETVYNEEMWSHYRNLHNKVITEELNRVKDIVNKEITGYIQIPWFQPGTVMERLTNIYQSFAKVTIPDSSLNRERLLRLDGQGWDLRVQETNAEAMFLITCRTPEILKALGDLQTVKYFKKINLNNRFYRGGDFEDVVKEHGLIKIHTFKNPSKTYLATGAILDRLEDYVHSLETFYNDRMGNYYNITVVPEKKQVTIYKNRDLGETTINANTGNIRVTFTQKTEVISCLKSPHEGKFLLEVRGHNRPSFRAEMRLKRVDGPKKCHWCKGMECERDRCKNQCRYCHFDLQDTNHLESECSKLCPTSALVKNNQRLSYRIQEFNDYLAEKPKDIPVDTWENEEVLTKLVKDTKAEQGTSRISYLDALKGAYKKGADRAELNRKDRDNQTNVGDTPYEKSLLGVMKKKVKKQNRGFFSDSNALKNKTDDQVLNEQLHNKAAELINNTEGNPPKRPSLAEKVASTTNKHDTYSEENQVDSAMEGNDLDVALNLSTNTVEPPAQKCSGDVEMEVKKPPEKDPEVLSDASSI